MIRPLDQGYLRVNGCVSIDAGGDIVVQFNRSRVSVLPDRIVVIEYSSECDPIDTSRLQVTNDDMRAPVIDPCQIVAQQGSYQVDTSVRGLLSVVFSPILPASECPPAQNDSVLPGINIGLVVGITVSVFALCVIIAITVVAVRRCRRAVFPFRERTENERARPMWADDTDDDA